jgi:hypothetical protein
MKIFDKILLRIKLWTDTEKNNRACPAKLLRSRGFVILFAVTLSAVILAIALGISSVALKEINFGTSAKDSGDASFATDTGLECALFNDKATDGTLAFGSGGMIQCGGVNISLTPTGASSWTFVYSGIGPTNLGCVNVSVTKILNVSTGSIATAVVSDGYNLGNGSCNSSNPNRVQRELNYNY